MTKMRFNHLVFTFVCFVFAISIPSGCTRDDSKLETRVKREPLAIPHAAAPKTSDDLKKLAENLFARPLNESEGIGTQRFSLIPENESGVEFSNELKRENNSTYIETGSGVALGDFDLDGRCDLFLLSTDGPNKLFRQTAAFKFEDVTESAGILNSDSWGAGATFADINNDGFLDLYVCNLGAPNELYINQGDGTFLECAESRGVAHVGASKIANFFDFDLDGDLDFYLLTYQMYPPEGETKIRMVNGKKTVHPDHKEDYFIVDDHILHAGQRDYFFENNGDGTFTDITDASGITGNDLGLSVTCWDVDHDSLPDLYVANDFETPDHLYRNNGDGTFSDILGDKVSHTSWFSMGSSAGDLNNDGLMDLMVADMSGTSHYKQKTNMGDMGNAAWFLAYGNPRQYMRNAVYVNTGTDRFLEVAYMANLDSTDWTWAVKFADLDNDSFLDVFISNGHNRNANDSDLKKQFARQASDEKELAELTLDIPPLKERNLVYRNKGDFDFDEVGADWNLDLDGISHGVATGDLDGDGDLDLVVNNLKDKVSIYRNESRASHRVTLDFRGHSSNSYGFGVRVDIWHGTTQQTRTLSPVSGYLSSDQPILHFGLGDDEEIDRMTVQWPSGVTQEFLDLEVGNHYRVLESEALVANRSTRSSNDGGKLKTAIFTETKSIDFQHAEQFTYNDFAREPLLPAQLSQLGPGIAWGDVNRDGRPDCYIGGARLQPGRLLINDGKSFASTSGPWDSDFQHEDMGALFFDFESDGDLDLYVVSGSNEFKTGSELYTDRLYLNTGDGSFKKSIDVIPDLKDSGSCVAGCDFDRDGDIDLFVGSRSIPGKYPLSPTSRLLINDNGKFVDDHSHFDETTMPHGLVNDAIWSDYNNDGWVDLMIAAEWGSIQVYQNAKGKLIDKTKELGLDETLGWWHGLAAGDFDADGDMDYIATNQGLNTKYHADASHPHTLYFDDFDDNGTLDLVEAEFEGDEEFPVRGRSCSSNSMPFIAEKFETFHEFGVAGLEEIYTPEISKSPKLQVNELRSMVIWNDGTDGMRMEPLPRIAQISPSYGISIGDFDIDGQLDVVLAQNFFGSQAETGFQDGGLGILLKGTGRQSFDTVWPADSGIVVPFDATSVTCTDTDSDGDLDVLFVCNDAPCKFLENTSEVSKARLSKFHFPAEISPFGAQIIVEFDDRKQKFEMLGSSGYLGNAHNELMLSDSQIESISQILIRDSSGVESKWQWRNK